MRTSRQWISKALAERSTARPDRRRRRGLPLHVGDIRAQLTQALVNLEVVLSQAGLELSDLVRLNIYTTDVDAAVAAYDALAGRLHRAESRQAGLLIGVARLAHHDLLVELEATAAG